MTTSAALDQYTYEDEADRKKAAEEWRHNADDDILGCRASGHAFAKIRTTSSGRLPKGITARRQFDGSYQITNTCRDCGTERTITTLPGGMIDLPAHYRYEYPKDSQGRNRYAAPKGSAEWTSRRECLYEVWRRTLETITAADPETAHVVPFSSGGEQQ